MSSFRTFTTTYVRSDEPDWAPLAAVSRLARSSPDLRSFHPGEFMWMCAVENKRKRLIIHLYKHYDTRCYINLDAAGHAYEYCERADDVADPLGTRPGFSGCYRLHRTLRDAVRRLRLWEFGEPDGLSRSFPPEEWPADPDDLAIGAYMDGPRFAWISAHAAPPFEP